MEFETPANVECYVWQVQVFDLDVQPGIEARYECLVG